MKILALLSLLLSFNSFGEELVKLHIGVDNKDILISLESLNKNLLGQIPQKDGQKIWKSKFSQIFIFEKELGCKVKSTSWLTLKKSIEAEAEINCAKKLKKSELKISLKKHFKNMSKLRVKVLAIPKGHDQVYDTEEIKLTL